MSDLTETRKEFWRTLTDEIKRRDTSLDPRKPTGEYYYKNGIGGDEWHLAFQAKVHPKEEIGCHLVLGHDESTFNRLIKEKGVIHDEIGETLRWISPENSDTSRYRIYCFEPWDVFEENRWHEYVDWLIDHGESFHSAFHKRLSGF